MRISRHLLMTCAVATFLTPTFVHAFDNEAQIRARQALEEKMKQVDTQTPPATSAPPAVVTNPAPAAEATPPAAKPMQRPSTNELMRAQQALDEKMKEMPAQTAPATSAPPAKVSKPAPVKKVKAPAPKPEPPVVTVTPNKTTVENPPAPATPAFAPEISQPATPAVAPATSAPSMTPSTDAATSDKLSDALHQKMHETETEPVTPVAPPVVRAQPPVQPETHMGAKPAPVPTPAPGATASGPTYAPIPEPSNTARPTLPETPTPTPAPAPTVTHNSKQPAPPAVSLPPLSGPPSSLSPAKQQKLDALLQQYRADQISPEQYHEQRAKILAEP